MALEGVTGAPYRHPEVRRKIPAGYQRPSINAGGAAVARIWKDTPVGEVKQGDTVAGLGIIASSETIVDVASSVFEVRMTNVLGGTRAFGGHDRVYAFTPEA